MAYSTSEMSEKTADVWDREIELQKTLGLTPSEAKMYTARENGATLEEIAEREALSTQTVKNVLTKARKKINEESQMEFFIIKSNINTDRAITESNISYVIAMICRNLGYNVRTRPHVITISGMDRSQTGDVKWFRANVERYVDLIGTRTDIASEERAKRVVDIYRSKLEEQSLEEPMFGHAVVRYYLDKFGLTYDVDETEE